MRSFSSLVTIQWKYKSLLNSIKCLSFKVPSSKWKEIMGALACAFINFLLNLLSIFSSLFILFSDRGVQTSGQNNNEEVKQASLMIKPARILSDPKFTPSHIDSIIGIFVIDFVGHFIR